MNDDQINEIMMALNKLALLAELKFSQDSVELRFSHDHAQPPLVYCKDCAYNLRDFCHLTPPVINDRGVSQYPSTVLFRDNGCSKGNIVKALDNLLSETKNL